MNSKDVSNYMVLMLMAIFWGVRLVATYCAATGRDFMITPQNQVVEIILLFVVVVCAALVYRRNIIGGIIYLVAYGLYFGPALFDQIINLIKDPAFRLDDSLDMIFSALGIILAIAVVMSLVYDKMKTPTGKKTEWFYDNKETDRKLDERADHNNYKLY